MNAYINKNYLDPQFSTWQQQLKPPQALEPNFFSTKQLHGHGKHQTHEAHQRRCYEVMMRCDETQLVIVN